MSSRAALLVLLLATLAAGCSRAKPPRIVVWIEVDALRADALGCYGNHSTGAGGRLTSPRIDALAADGVRFEHAYASAPAARASLATQLTGQWPWEEASAQTLFARVRELGWRSAGVSTDPDVPGAQGLERWDASQRTSPAALTRLCALADELVRDPGQGLFLFGWLSEPDYPFEAHADLQFGPAYGGALHGDGRPPSFSRAVPNWMQPTRSSCAAATRARWPSSTARWARSSTSSRAAAGTTGR